MKERKGGGGGGGIKECEEARGGGDEQSLDAFKKDGRSNLPTITRVVIT
jgi:hypothetical protein